MNTATFTDYDLERERILRRRKLAEAMLADSQRGLGDTQTIGGVAVRRSPLEGVAKVAQAYHADTQSKELDQKEKDLAQQRLDDTKGALGEYQRAITPRAAVASAMQEDASGNAWNSDAQAAYAPGPQDKQNAAYGLLARLGGDPRETAKLVVAQALKAPEVGKVDVDKFTPGSVAKYSQTGNYTDLVPRDKVDFVNGQAVDPYATKPGTVIASPPTEIERELLAAGMTKGSPEWNAAMSQRVKKQTTHQPGTTVNVSTEKKYGESFAGKVADQDVGLLDAARKAPELATRANQVKEILASGKVITGAGADYRLTLGKALNLAGASDAETIANTEALSVNLARNTLDSIKASGLGSGSGFSNADRDFLEKAAGGKITLEGATIGRLADLSHRAADQSAAAWNKRVKDIPDSALGGTGIKRDPIAVPALHGAKGKQAVRVSPEVAAFLRANKLPVPGE